MSTIYKLNFKSGDTYIGQTSQPVEARINQHRHTRGKGCPLLFTAWQYQEYVGYDILEDNIPLDLLDAREQYWIEELKPTLNTLPGGNGLRGLNHPRAKYTQEQLENVVALYLNSNLSYTEISEETRVEISTVHDVLKRRKHTWLWEVISPQTLEAASRRRKTTYRLWDIDNNLIEWSGTLSALAAHLGIYPQYITNVLNGGESAIGIATQPHPELLLTDPDGETWQLTLFRANEFLKTYSEISPFQRRNILQGKNTTTGWKAKFLDPQLLQKNSVA